jgi:protein SCO1/2
MSPTFWRTIARCVARIACAVAVALAPLASALAYLAPSQAAQRAGFAQRLSARVPPTLAFRDETGRAVELRDYFGASPVILVFAWYGCTTLCPTVIAHLAATLAQSGLAKDSYRVVVVSIDPRDAPADAARMKRLHLDAVDASADWHLLTGKPGAIATLADAAGFRYAYDDETHQYAHPAGAVLLTPEGEIARYYLGVGFTAGELQDGVRRAAASEIASPVDQLLLLCFHFAPAGSHSASILAALRIGCATFVVGALALFASRRRRSA